VTALKRRGRFVVPGPAVITSGRKLRAFSAWQVLRQVWPLFVFGPEAYRRREELEIWYGEQTERRTNDEDGSRAPGAAHSAASGG